MVHYQPGDDRDINIYGSEIWYHGEHLPRCPKLGKRDVITVVYGKVYANGREWDGDRWKVSLKALFHFVF